MPREVPELVREIETARSAYLDRVDGLTDDQGSYRAQSETWSVQEITEHLVLAERMGVHFVWMAAEAAECGHPLWAGEHDNLGSTIEEVVRRTWREREVAPDAAAPRGEGSLSLWTAELRALDSLTQALGQKLSGADLESIVYPHFLSGSLDACQRLQFIRFHLERHTAQAETLIASAGFPS